MAANTIIEYLENSKYVPTSQWEVKLLDKEFKTITFIVLDELEKKHYVGVWSA